MQMNKLIIGILVISVIAFLYQKQTATPETNEPEQLKITSTKPATLDEATILPTDTIEITLNKPIYRSELKHRFDPEINHEVETINGIDKELGQTFRIIFQEPLGLGKGYTLFILSNTHDQENHNLDHEYIYHFKTISYRGI